LSPFNAKRVLRQTSIALLRQLVTEHAGVLSISWDQLAQTQIDGLFHALQTLPEGPREEIEAILRDLDDIAHEDGIRVMIEEGDFRGVDIHGQFEVMQSQFDQAAWVLLHHPQIWSAAMTFARADGLPGGRSWRRRSGLPAVVPKTDDAHKAALASALSAFFREREGRGHHAHVDHIHREGQLDYFHVYLSDYAATHINFDDQGQLCRTPERRVFEVVFAYSRNSGTLDLFAKGGSKVVESLQQIFCRVILGAELPPAESGAKPYRLDHLMNREMGFPTDPQDGIMDVSVLSMRIAVLGSSRRRILLEPDPEAGPDAIYDMLEADLNRERLPRHVLRVVKVTLRFRFTGHGRHRSLTFDVTYPNSSNLKSKREEHRLLGEKYLKRFGIDVT
jgi:hypothetical protein